MGQFRTAQLVGGRACERSVSRAENGTERAKNWVKRSVERAW